MGHSNGQHEKPSRREKVKIGIGLKSTPDNYFDLQNKRLTNISAPMDDHDAVTKRFVADLLKTKAATTYVNNELTKKANSSALKEYALITDLGTLAIEFNDALKDKVDYNDLETNTKKTKAPIHPFITVYAEENGPLIKSSLQWSFGNGSEKNKQYGWPSPVDGKIVRGSICACAGNRQASEVIVGLVLNGASVSNGSEDVKITKPADEWSNHTIFSDPITIKAGDRINFRSKTSNSSVTHAMVNLLIEIDIAV